MCDQTQDLVNSAPKIYVFLGSAMIVVQKNWKTLKQMGVFCTVRQPLALELQPVP